MLQKGIKIKIKAAKFRASRRFRFEDTKRIMSPEIRPKSFGTFEKQADPESVFKHVVRIFYACGRQLRQKITLRLN